MKKLKCPQCRSVFDNVKIEYGAVRCPFCGATMFRYKFDDENNLTPDAFMKLMDTRGADAAKAAMDWFPSNVRFKQVYSAGMFIAFIWPHLAMTFARNDDDQSPEQPQPEPA